MRNSSKARSLLLFDYLVQKTMQQTVQNDGKSCHSALFSFQEVREILSSSDDRERRGDLIPEKDNDFLLTRIHRLREKSRAHVGPPTKNMMMKITTEMITRSNVVMCKRDAAAM